MTVPMWGNILRAIVEHSLPEAEELEKDADLMIEEATKKRKRATAIRMAYAIAYEEVGPGGVFSQPPKESAV